MYLSKLSLWNFRKYGIQGESFEKANPGVSIQFGEGLNVLVGENDSGKTAIVDAIRYTLGTQSDDWIRVEESDFHTEDGHRAQDLKIECLFRGFSLQEAGQFLEWLGTEDVNGQNCFVLNVRFTAQIMPDRIVTDLRAGADPVGIPMDGDARALLRVTYLKPLRDADAELTPGRRSRFAQILKAHALFQKDRDKDHELETIFTGTNSAIMQYFARQDDDSGATTLMKQLETYLKEFFPQNERHIPTVSISGGDLVDILKRLSLSLDTNPCGLGAANFLFIAAELLLLQSEEKYGLRLALVEELEAHLHPQAQLRLIRYLQKRATEGQYILTTHSTTIGASVPLERLLICKGDKVFSMGSHFTKLEPKDYGFLERFLDATKANLFFARGVLLVEGAAENLLIPVIAKAIDRPLHRYDVSIVNVGSKAFAHYARIFHRHDENPMGIKVAIITDMDVRPLESTNASGESPTVQAIENEKLRRREQLADIQNSEVRVFLSPNWTMEYEIALSSFREELYRAMLWAEKITNSQTGRPLEGKMAEVDAQVRADSRKWIESWREVPREAEKIAYEIYQHHMVDRDISKAVTAQALADHLDWRLKEEDGTGLQSDLQKASSLGYLLEAIYHVTEPKETSSEG